jgi:hypothetical protein
VKLPAPADNAAMETTPPKADKPKRKRRRFQFRLRTLMISVAVLAIPCAYVGWQENIVRERWAMRKRVKEVDDGFVSVSVDRVVVVIEESGPQSRKESAISIPWIRRLLGDEPIEQITLPSGTAREERQRIHKIIPEADLVWSMPHIGGLSETVFPFRDDESKD